MKANPHCKINLGLYVLGKRKDGYHDIETIFVPVYDLRDDLEITESDTPQMIQDGIELDNAPEDNLCMKAWILLHTRYGIPPVKIRLKKNIPFGAGLGGGSSDAAFTLKLLSDRYLQLSSSELTQLAASLGSDCPFFLDTSMAHATGRGELLHAIQCPALDNYRIAIEMPKDEHVSTKEAYAGISPHLFSLSRPTLTEIINKPIEEWGYYLVNDFEESVFRKHPAIAALKYDMYKRGAVYASMTGSGAAVYGIFPK